MIETNCKENRGQIKKPGGSSKDGWAMVLKCYFLEIIGGFFLVVLFPSVVSKFHPGLCLVS